MEGCVLAAPVSARLRSATGFQLSLDSALSSVNIPININILHHLMKKLLAILACACTVLCAPPLQADEAAAASVDSRPDPNWLPTQGNHGDPGIAAPGDTHSEAAASVLTPAPESLWNRIRQGFALPEIDSPLVARHEAWFLNH